MLHPQLRNDICVGPSLSHSSQSDTRDVVVSTWVFYGSLFGIGEETEKVGK